MRRRRLRVFRVIEDDAQLTRRLNANKAAEVQHGDSASPTWLNRSQLHMLEMQQNLGNQSAMRLMRGVIQRAPDDEQEQGPDGDSENKDENAKESTLGEAVDTGKASSELSNKDDAKSLIEAGITAYRAKHYGTALIAFREGFRISPSSHLLYNMGICELRLDLFQEAQDDFAQAIDHEGLSARDRNRAVAALDSARKLESSGSIGYLQLPSNVNTDESPLAKEPRAIRNQISAFYRSAENAAKSEDYDAALTAFRIAQRRLPHPVTQINIAKCLIMLQRYNEATSILELAMHDRQMVGPVRQMAEAEREASRRFQELRFDDLGTPPA